MTSGRKMRRTLGSRAAGMGLHPALPPAAFRALGLLLCCGALLLPLLVGPGLCYGQWPIVQLTDNDLEDTKPDVSGTNTVWQTGPLAWGPDLYWHDGHQTRLVTSNVAWYAPPHVSGDTIVWVGGTDWEVENEVHIYQDSTITRVTAPGKTSGDRYADVSGSTVVWENSGWIWQYANGQVTKVSSGRANGAPAISDRHIVWPHWDGYWMLKYFDGVSEITLDAVDIGDPAISDGRVACAKGNNQNAEIFLLEPGASQRITSNTWRDWQADISGTLVVWSGYDGHDYEIYLYDGTDILPVTDNQYDDAYPAISGDRVVWQGYDGHDNEIFTARVPEPATLALLAVGGLLLIRRRAA